MYTKKWNWLDSVWEILDPEGDKIADVGSTGQADILLSHLNRG